MCSPETTMMRWTRRGLGSARTRTMRGLGSAGQYPSRWPDSAMAGFDVAAWDALAIAAGWPLATLIGSSPKRIPAYNSCGLGLMAPREAADEAEKLLARGFRAVKLRLGYPTLAEDLAALHAVK